MTKGDFRSLRLVFNQKPIPKQSARFVSSISRKIVSYQSSVIKQYEKNILIEALSQVNGGFKPLEGCLSVEIEFMYRHPINIIASHKNHIKSGGKIRKITVPDVTDNLNKPIFDALQGRFYKNDSIISTIKASKLFGLHNRITLVMSEIDIFMP